ncbi:MAG: SDR family oxidoreductase [Acidobacteriota bacterium]
MVAYPGRGERTVDLGLRGRVALVGGASRGLGYACARQLAGEGASVALCARDASQVDRAVRRIQAETGADLFGFSCDLARPEAPDAWVAASQARFGPIDILVHNTGGPPPGDFDELDDAAWEQAFQLLLMSAIRLYRAVIPGMRRRKWGRIVAIESISVREPIDGLLLSNALRPGVAAVGKSLSRRLAADGILVNCVAPGSFNTARSRGLAEARARRAGIPVEELMARSARDFPRGRPGEPAELAALVSFLCSEKAGNVNGATVVADGGVSRSLA